MRKELYPDNWPELRAACLERAGYQCEYVDPATGKRCQIKDQQIRRSKRTGRRWIVALYASHSKNSNPGDPNPELLCLCPAHHMMLDRNTELKERLSQRRRGYGITTTDALIQAVSHYGIHISETSGGYCWTLASTGTSGERTTALDALCAAIREMQETFSQEEEPTTMKKKETSNPTSQTLFPPVICAFPGCFKRAREEYRHPNGMIKPYCTEHIRKVRNAEKTPPVQKERHHQ